jgi:hypothetical protein
MRSLCASELGATLLVSRVVKSLPRLTSLLTGSVSTGMLLLACSLSAVDLVPASQTSHIHPTVAMDDVADLGGIAVRAAG